MGGGTPNANSLRQQQTSASDLPKGPLQGWPLRPPTGPPLAAAVAQQQQQPSQHPPLKDTMPLSPPLTPLPPSIGRFPQMPMLGHMGPYQHLLLAAQYGQQNPFMPRPNPLMPNGLPMEFMEQLQRLIQLRNLGNAEPKQGRDYFSFLFEIHMSLIFFQIYH